MATTCFGSVRSWVRVRVGARVKVRVGRVRVWVRTRVKVI